MLDNETIGRAFEGMEALRDATGAGDPADWSFGTGYRDDLNLFGPMEATGYLTVALAESLGIVYVLERQQGRVAVVGLTGPSVAGYRFASRLGDPERQALSGFRAVSESFRGLKLGTRAKETFYVERGGADSPEADYPSGIDDIGLFGSEYLSTGRVSHVLETGDIYVHRPDSDEVRLLHQIPSGTSLDEFYEMACDFNMPIDQTPLSTYMARAITASREPAICENLAAFYRWRGGNSRSARVVTRYAVALDVYLDLCIPDHEGECGAQVYYVDTTGDFFSYSNCPEGGVALIGQIKPRPVRCLL